MVEAAVPYPNNYVGARWVFFRRGAFRMGPTLFCPSVSHRRMPTTDASSSEAAGESPGAPRRHVHPADLPGLAQLATEATLGTTRLVEAVHAAVWASLRPGVEASSRTAGLTGFVYRAVRRITRLAGSSAGQALGAVAQTLDSTPPPDTDERRRALSILNGVFGDHLAASDSPLACSFSLRTPAGQRLPASATDAAPLVVFVHGLCLSDRAWAPTADRPGHVDALAAPVGGTPVLARYNTGRSISENGRALSEHLSRLTGRSAGPSRIVLVTHSMGGLVTRSAVRHAHRAAARWPHLVTNTIYLGTPHRGSPLERAGTWVEQQLRRTPVTAPFASLATLRSRGIQDLRRGTIASDAAHDDTPDRPPGRSLYVAAALTSRPPARDAVGDGLVPVASALDASGPTRSATREVVENRGHLDLLHDPAVTEHLRRWLSTTSDA